MVGLSASGSDPAPDNDPMRRHDGIAALRRAAVFVLSTIALAACSPVFDWREAQPEGSGLTMMFPCRPTRVERQVRVEGTNLTMQLHSCTAGGATFSLVVANAGSAANVAPLLVALREGAVANVAGAAQAASSPAIVGAMPNAQSGRVRIEGRLPDGRSVVEHAAFFGRGPWAYQATVLTMARPVTAETLDTFFAALRLR